MNHKQSLINSLVSIAGDYQKVDFNSSHVQRWVEQFPDDSHKVLLRNLVSILEKTHYSKNKVEVFKLIIFIGLIHIHFYLIKYI